MLDSKFIGGMLLIVGTSIGGGMLALPVSTAEVGFFHSIFFLIMCWLIMTSGALLLLEVNLRLPAGTNMVSMAKETLGMPGQIVAWITYLLLLYTLLAAYISGGGDVFHGLLQQIHINIPTWLSALLFTGIFSIVVYTGMQAVDYVNRGFMLGKLGIYLILVVIISPHADLHALSGGKATAITGCLMVLVASFGFASIVPSLREYFQEDTQTLRRVILIGSLIPLTCYIIWDGLIMSVVQREGSGGLLALRDASNATSGLTEALTQSIHSAWITGFFSFFTSICMITAFLGVSIGLFDFLADGLTLKKKGMQGKGILAITFVPPLAIVLFNPGIYLRAFSYAGICCIILLLVMPVLMTWKARRLSPAPEQQMIPGGNILLGFLFIVGIYLLTIAM